MTQMSKIDARATSASNPPRVRIVTDLGDILVAHKLGLPPGWIAEPSADEQPVGAHA